nr:NADH dehydrogenase subunit 6 [Deleaster bactrianus]
MIMILFILLINTSMTFIFMKHPLSMGFLLLAQITLIALMMTLISNNSWFSYILFIIMVGGLLILFIYMTSLASNEKFKFSFKIMILNITNIMFMFLTYFIDQMNFNLMNKFNFNNYMININMNKFFIFPSYFIMIMIIIYLFITLIAVVKISNFKSGPLRQKI